jgi:hypothetical protein
MKVQRRFQQLLLITVFVFTTTMAKSQELTATFALINALPTIEKSLNEIAPVTDETIAEQSSLVLETQNIESRRLLRISFNGNEGTNGYFELYNYNNDLVKQSKFELIKFPFYASVDVTDLEAGTYAVRLTTSDQIHYTNLVIE